MTTTAYNLRRPNTLFQPILERPWGPATMPTSTFVNINIGSSSPSALPQRHKQASTHSPPLLRPDGVAVNNHRKDDGEELSGRGNRGHHQRVERGDGVVDEVLPGSGRQREDQEVALIWQVAPTTTPRMSRASGKHQSKRLETKRNDKPPTNW